MVLFYAALHRVHAYLAHYHGEKPVGHEKRGRAIRRWLKALYTDYRELQTASENARYDTGSVTQADIERLVAGPYTRIKAATRLPVGRP